MLKMATQYLIIYYTDGFILSHVTFLEEICCLCILIFLPIS